MRVSFIVPVFDTDIDVLRLSVNSILKAAGNEHELVLVDDESRRPETRAFVDRCADSGIANLVVLRNAENSGVSYTLNSAASAATGTMLAPVDHDDVVVSQGFEQLLRCARYYDSAWAYSDEIQVDAKGFLIRRMFKPDYSPQLLRSTMYINHLQIFSRDLFERVGGYREGFEGSQDHDLALRMSEQVSPVHAETVAYHWRIMDQTQSRAGETLSSDSRDRSQLALREHFERRGVVARVEPALFTRSGARQAEHIGVYRSRLVPARVPMISILIPCKLGTTRLVNGTRRPLLEDCLRSVRASLPAKPRPELVSPDLEVILILNHDDDSAAADQILSRQDLPGRAICDEPGFNFSRKCNLGVSEASGDVLIFLNDDTEIRSPEWSAAVISLLAEDDVACVGGMLLNDDGTVQSCGDNVGRNSAVHYAPTPDADDVGDPMHRYLADHETTSISGAFLCCSRKTFMNLGGFSLAFPNSFQDVDFCQRARLQGQRCVVSPQIRLVHFESATRDSEVDYQTLSAFRSFHGPELAGTDRYALWRYQPIYFSVFSYNGLKVRLLRVARIFVRITRRLERRLTRRPRCWRGVLKRSEFRVH